MRLDNGAIRLSASDLSAFVSCKHLTLLELARTHELELPERTAEHAALADLAARGDEHERAVLERYRDVFATGRPDDICEVPGKAPDADRAALTREALLAGRAVIYQGVLLRDDRFGAPDFLVKAELLEPGSGLEGYAVVDAKLARSAKANAVLQTTFYSRLLAEETGVEPTWMYLELGDGSRERLRVADFAAYEQETFRRLQGFVDRAPAYPIGEPYPDKVEHCGICSWRTVCRTRRRDDDDLSLVAFAGLRERKALKDGGVSTRRALGELDVANPPAVDVAPRTLERLHLQAKAQLATDAQRTPYWEFADDEASLTKQLADAQAKHDPAAERQEPLRGLFALPAPDRGDLFFDLEASRFFGGDGGDFGLEYLFGVVEQGNKDAKYSADWAFDRDGERAVFERFITKVYARWLEHPGMHVYHYNHYEPTALDRLADRHSTMTELLGSLMGRHGTKEEETDVLFRNGVFVDLYPIFRQAIRAGIESYSLKQTERVAGYERAQELEEADGHMVAFQSALDQGPDAARSLEDTQHVIAAYNEDDCRGTLALRDWLEQRRTELAGEFGDIPRPPAVLLEQVPADSDHSDLRDALLSPRRDGDDGYRRLLADLLGYQKRENKPAWWEFFYLRAIDAEERVRSGRTIGGLICRGAAGEYRGRKVRPVVEFEFPPQEHDFEPGDICFDPDVFGPKPDAETTVLGRSNDGPAWKVIGVDEMNRRLQVALPEEGLPEPVTWPTAFVPDVDIVGNYGPTEALARYGRSVCETDFDCSPVQSALLRCTEATVQGGQPLPVPEAATDLPSFATQLALRLDPGCLPIQGPPGTGKTFTGAEVVVGLLESDPSRRIGVTGPSHAVIRNFLRELAARRSEHGAAFQIGQYSSNGDDLWEDIDESYRTPARAVAALQQGTCSVLGATAWFWSRDEVQADGGLLDTLIIDEAGQMSLAFGLAAAGAARNRLVVLGDPQQLPQIRRGTHPEGAGGSVLEHLLGDERVMPTTRGVFLDRTRRMHDEITAFVSDAFYLGELTGDATLGLNRQSISGPSQPVGSGLRLADVDHEGNDSGSPEEAERVAGLVAELLERGWVDRDGVERPIDPSDLMIVTPYNAQIQAIAKALAQLGVHPVDVGTVDKFQGREAAAVIYSMATSSADKAPRGMEFLYQLNRLNVATSRAKAMAIVVMSPELVRVDCKTPRQMMLASAHCLLRERATAI